MLLKLATNMKAMVLAAGEGTRLRPYTLTTPKPMLPVAGRPTLEWIVGWLRYHGIREVVVNLCHQPDPVVDHFGNGSSHGVQMTYSVEETMLGTAGGVKNVEHLFDGPFVIVYGDVLTDMNLAALVECHQAHGPQPHVTLSLCRRPNPWDCGIVGVNGDNRVTKFVEKPRKEDVFSDLVNAGVLVMDRQLLDFVQETGFSDISHDLLPELLRRNVPIYAQPLDETVYLIDMGTQEKYEQAQREWPTEVAVEYFECEN